MSSKIKSTISYQYTMTQKNILTITQILYIFSGQDTDIVFTKMFRKVSKLSNMIGCIFYFIFYN